MQKHHFNNRRMQPWFGSFSVLGRIVLGGLLTGFVSFGLAPKTTQAQYSPTAVRPANPWQYASFPVENFQSYTSEIGRAHV